MSKSNLMIRLIDIVFILLFGFIAVSQIDSVIAIEPPKSTEAKEGVPGAAEIIMIGVSQNGTFLIGEGDQVLENIQELRRYLSQKANEAESGGKQPGIRIRANWDAKVADGIAVAKICRDLGLPKGLDVIKRY